MAATPSLIAGAVFFTFVYVALSWLKTFRSRAKLIAEHNCKPARRYPQKDPIFGLDYFLAQKKAYEASNLLEKADQDHKKYGPTFVVNQLGDTIVSKDPAVVKSALKTDFGSWGVAASRFEACVPFLGRSFFILDGAEWNHKRTQTRPALSKNEYGDLERLENHFQRFRRLIPDDGSTVNMKHPFERLLQAVSTEYFLGEAVNTLSTEPNPEDAELIDSMDTGMFHIANRLMMGRLLKFMPVDKSYRNAAKVVGNFVDKNIIKAIERKHGGNSVKSHRIFLDDMIDETNDKTLIHDAALTMYAAGAETTSSTLSSVVWALSRHPDVVDKIRQEIAQVSPKIPNLEALTRMKYLRATIQEIMRLYGITNSFNYRQAVKDTVLPVGGGPDGKDPLFVKKGTNLVLCYYSMHRDPALWGPDVNQLKPERHLNKDQRDFWQLQIFGGGPRNCPGQNLAFTNMCYIITRLLQEFKGVESRDDRPYTEYLKLTPENKYGALVGMIPA